MKKMYSLFLAVLIAGAVSAENEISVADWNFIGDSTTTGASYLMAKKFANGDTLIMNGISTFYVAGEKTYEVSDNNAGNGAYWHHSSEAKGDNIIALTVQGRSQVEVVLNLRPGSKTAVCKFYAFVREADADISTEKFYSQTDKADAATEWSHNEYTEKTMTLNLDLKEKDSLQTIYIILLSSDEKGLRHRGTKCTVSIEKEVTPPEPSSKTLVADWNFIGDSTSTSPEHAMAHKFADGDTLTMNGISTFYVQGEKTYDVTDDVNAGYGGYWHNSSSSKGDNMIAITVPAKSDVEIILNLRPGSKTAVDNFYAFARDASADISNEVFYSQTDKADATSEWTLNAWTEKTMTLNLDLKQKEVPQTIYILFISSESSKGVRHRGIKCSATIESGSTTPTSVVEIESEFDSSMPAYNLMGQPVKGNYKGIVVQNGKKYLLR
ncbi:MAG: hypothetical protein IJ650_06785 [Paludibacteraceae bacterium]|nr:hypothetical protein [Paludibacteraceae bacterium]